MGDLLRIEDLSSGYGGKAVLRNISFSVGKGEVLAIIGQNGCGKSTLLKSIARIISDNSGMIIFNDMKLNHLHSWELKQVGISYFMQGGMLFPTMRVSEHFDLVLKDRNRRDAASIKEECFSYFPELANCMDRRGGNLSGGQRQMLSFAMLISQQTKCWLLDEPTAGLAPQAVKDAVEFLKRMKLQARLTIVLVEHNYQVAFELADRVAIIKQGRLYDNFPRTEFQKENFLNNHMYN
jgi:ABC-type branched-subunit amino acid transport system ATPase component